MLNSKLILLHLHINPTSISRSPGYDRDYRSSRDEYRPSSRGGRDAYEDRERVEPRSSERGYGRSEY